MKRKFSASFFPSPGAVRRVFMPFSLLALLLVSLHAGAVAQDKAPQKPFTNEDLMKMDRGKMRPPSGARFDVIFAEGTKAMYAVLLHNDERRFVQDLYHISQLEIIEAMVGEAKKFALTEEAVGGAKPLTTRFSNEQLPNFFIDVSKMGKQTRFYITMKGSNGTMTLEAGAIRRGAPAKKPDEVVEPMLFDTLIERIQAAKQPN